MDEASFMLSSNVAGTFLVATASFVFIEHILSHDITISYEFEKEARAFKFVHFTITPKEIDERLKVDEAVFSQLGFKELGVINIKTIAQVAKDLGVSKTAVRNKIAI